MSRFEQTNLDFHVVSWSVAMVSASKVTRDCSEQGYEQLFTDVGCAQEEKLSVRAACDAGDRPDAERVQRGTSRSSAAQSML